MDQDRLAVRCHGQAIGLEGRLDAPENLHPARLEVANLNRNLRARRPGLNEARLIPSPVAAAGTVVHAGVDDSPAQESYARHNLAWFPSGQGNGQQWRVS